MIVLDAEGEVAFCDMSTVFWMDVRSVVTGSGGVDGKGESWPCFGRAECYMPYAICLLVWGVNECAVVDAFWRCFCVEAGSGYK